MFPASSSFSYTDSIFGSSPSLSKNVAVPGRPSSSSLFEKITAKPQSKKILVNSLVCSTAILLNTLWHEFNPRSSRSTEPLGNLNSFIISILRRSKSSNLTLQVALYYLICLSDTINKAVIKKFHKKHLSVKQNVLFCKKRTFLTCLILASKFVQDKNYSMKSWSLISGLPAKELAHNEFLVLQCLNFNLYVKGDVFNQWSIIVSYFVLMSSKTLIDNTSDGTATMSISENSQHLLNHISAQWNVIIKNLDCNYKLSNNINYFDLLLTYHQKLTHTPVCIEAC